MSFFLLAGSPRQVNTWVAGHFARRLRKHDPGTTGSGTALGVESDLAETTLLIDLTKLDAFVTVPTLVGLQLCLLLELVLGVGGTY